MKYHIWVSVKETNYYKLISKIKDLQIPIYNLKIESRKILLEIDQKNFSNLKKYLVSYNFQKEADLGLLKIINNFKNKKRFLIALLIGLLFLFVCSNIIVEVDVIHSKSQIRKLVTEALEENGIKRLTLKKNYHDLSKIKEKILDEYQDELEWIEIETHGMKYIIRIEERIITEKKTPKNSCNLIATKSGIITKIVTHQGVSSVNIGKYVSAGDILVLGNVILNDEIKDTVCASGKIYAEVWYIVKVKIPLYYQEEKYSGKERYNLMLANQKDEYVILKSRLKNKKVENKKIFSLLNTTFYLQKEKEIKIKEKKYTEKEAIDRGFLLAIEKVKLKLTKNEKIIAQKVLKKNLNDSTMDLEVFVSVEELISKQVEFQNEELGNNDDLERSE